MCKLFGIRFVRVDGYSLIRKCCLNIIDKLPLYGLYVMYYSRCFWTNQGSTRYCLNQFFHLFQTKLLEIYHQTQNLFTKS